VGASRKEQREGRWIEIHGRKIGFLKPKRRGNAVFAFVFAGPGTWQGYWATFASWEDAYRFLERESDRWSEHEVVMGRLSLGPDGVD
jgi:hypothetical protein